MRSGAFYFYPSLKGLGMTQQEFEQELAAATGETHHFLRRRGFQLIEAPTPPPLVVDWDEIYPIDPPRRVQRRRSARQVA